MNRPAGQAIDELVLGAALRPAGRTPSRISEVRAVMFASGSSYSRRAAQRRAGARRRSAHRVVTALTPAQLQRDPLTRRTPGWADRLGTTVIVAIGAVSFYGLMFAVFAGIGGAVAGPVPTPRQATTVQVHDIPAPMVPIAPEPQPIAAEPEHPAKRAPKKIAKAPEAKPDVLPPTDPTQKPRAEEPAPSKSRRRIVGLDFGSTVSGGSGPSFAVGNTRMGSTATTAADPDAVEVLVPDPSTPNPARSNRVASHVPTAGVRLTKPRLANDNGERAQPPYPELLRQQGVEADVVVVVEISNSGAVKNVTLARSSSYPEFNEAARKAAKAERYVPATRNGRPIPFTLEFTYRFRLDQT